MKKKTRQANIELLRIVAMLMVVILHYLVKGGAASSLADNFSAINVLFWLVKALCIVAVNVYVLISGYFLLETKWSISRLVRLWLQVIFYSLGVPVVCLCLGIGEVEQWGLYDWVNVLFPVQMEHYWFVTAYVILYIMVPVLSEGVKKLSKKQHGWLIIGLLLIFSLPKTVLPILIPIDRYGYDFGWFICLFLIAAYIRLHGISIFERKINSFGIYFASVMGIWGISMVCAILSRKGLPLTYMMDMTYCYNHILVLIAAVGLFYGFKYLRIPEGMISKIICKVSPYTLGVYLLHENLAVRTRWQFWAGVEKVRGEFGIFPYMIVTVIAVFVAGIMVDYVRHCIFEVVIRVWKSIFAGKIAESKK